MRALLILSILILSGCEAMERAHERREAYYREEAARNQAAYREGLNRDCRAMGFTEGTDSYSNCLLQLHSANQQNNAAMRNMLLQGLIANQKPTTIQPIQPYQTPVPRTTNTNCVPNGTGGFTCATR